MAMQGLWCNACRRVPAAPGFCNHCGARLQLQPQPQPQHQQQQQRHQPQQPGYVRPYYAPPPPPKSRALFAVIVFLTFLMVGAAGAATFFYGGTVLASAGLGGGGGTSAPPVSTVIPPVPIGPAVATARAPISAATGGFVALPTGARVDVAARAFNVDLDLVLSRVAIPANIAGRDRLIGEGYHLTASKRSTVDGLVTLALPFDPSKLPAGTRPESVTAYAFNGRTLYALPGSKVDLARRLVVVSYPAIEELGSGATYAPYRQGAPPPPTPTPTPTAPLTAGLADPTKNVNPFEIYGVGLPPPVPPGTCGVGNPGEVLMKQKHAFAIVFEVNASCGLANTVSDELQKAYEIYAKDYASAGQGLNPLRQFTWMHPMKVFLRPLEGDVNGEYEHRSFDGYIAVDPNIAEKWGDDAPAKRARLEKLRNTLYHELFHAVENRYRSLLVAGVSGARWWMEAAAERAAQKVRGLDYDGSVRDAYEHYGRYVPSVPIESSNAFNGNTLSYGYAMLLAHAERTSPTYIRDTLNGSATSSSAYFQGLIDAGKLETTYANFARDLLVRAPSTAPWLRGRIVEGETETRVGQPSLAIYGDPSEKLTRVTDKTQRGAPQRFRFKTGPMTTHFLSVQAVTAFSKPKTVELTMSVSTTQPSMVGRVDGYFMPQGGSSPQPSAASVTPFTAGTKTSVPGRLGESYSMLWIAVTNTQRSVDAMIDFDITIKPEEEPPPTNGSFLKTDPPRVIASLIPMRRDNSELRSTGDAPGQQWSLHVRQVRSAQAGRDEMALVEKNSKTHYPARWATATSPYALNNGVQTCTPSNECSYGSDLIIDALASVCVAKTDPKSWTGSNGSLYIHALYREIWLIEVRAQISTTEAKSPYPNGSAAAAAADIVGKAKRLIDERFPPPR